MIIIRAMNPYELLWIVLLIVFVLGELATIGLTCIWFAAGALAALVMAMAGVNPVVQFLVFLVVSILLLAATRPWARKYVNAKMQRTNADSLIGENIRISERVSNMDQTGMAVVHGLVKRDSRYVSLINPVSTCTLGHCTTIESIAFTVGDDMETLLTYLKGEMEREDIQFKY